MINGDFDCFHEIGFNYVKKSELEQLKKDLKVYKLISNSFSILMDIGIVFDDSKNDGRIIYSEKLHKNERVLLDYYKNNDELKYLSIAFTLDDIKDKDSIINQYLNNEIEYRPMVFSEELSSSVECDSDFDITSLKYLYVPTRCININNNYYEVQNIIEVNELLYLLSRYSRCSIDEDMINNYLKKELINKKYINI